jgi:hypothetical protein
VGEHKRGVHVQEKLQRRAPVRGVRAQVRRNSHGRLRNVQAPQQPRKVKVAALHTQQELQQGLLRGEQQG